MRLITLVIAIAAVVAICWLYVETRALHAPSAASPVAPASPSPPVVAAPSSPSAGPARPSRPLPHTRGSGEPSLPPAEPAQPPPPSGPVAPAETAAALHRVEGVLLAVARVCALPSSADRTQHLVFHVTTSRDRVEKIEHRDGALPDAVVACVDKRLYAARWPAVPAPLVLELDVRAAELP